MLDKLHISLEETLLSLTSEAVEMTCAMVRCDSQSPPSDTRAVVDVAKDALAKLPGVEVFEHCRTPPVVNLVARLKGNRAGPRLILSGHIDTYPIGDSSSWKTEPFSASIADGRLYGRGSCDMKGGVAAAMAVMRLFATEAQDFPGEIILALAGDEETMGELGTQAMIEDLDFFEGGAVIVPDVGAPQVPRCGEKGMLWVRVTSYGRSSHGAHVHRGRNAINTLIQTLISLKELENMRMPQDHPAAEIMAAAEAVSEPLGGIGERDVMSRVTVNLGTLHGGGSPNLVPERAAAELDIRIPLGVSVSEVEARVRGLIGDNDDISIDILRAYEPSWTDPDHEIVQAVLRSSENCFSGKVVPNMRVGASDARLWRRAGHPTVVAGLSPGNLGAPDEFLELEELPRLIRLLALAAARYLTRSEAV